MVGQMTLGQESFRSNKVIWNIIWQFYNHIISSWPSQVPIPLTKYWLNSKFDNDMFMYIFFYIHSITVKCCIYYDSCVVLVYVRFHCDWFSLVSSMGSIIFIKIGIWSKYHQWDGHQAWRQAINSPHYHSRPIRDTTDWSPGFLQAWRVVSWT